MKSRWSSKVDRDGGSRGYVSVEGPSSSVAKAMADRRAGPRTVGRPSLQSGTASLASISGERRNLSRPAGAGFTLLEVLVAATITLGLAGLMLAVVTNTLNLWHRTQDNFTATTQAKLVLDLLERDLQAAVFRADGSTWLAIDVLNSSNSLTTHGWLPPGSLSKPAGSESQRLAPVVAAGITPLISNARFGLSGAWLRLIATNVESDGSLPVAVSYQIARRPLSGAINAANPAAVRYSLFRSAVSAENTLAAGPDVTAPGYGSTSVNPAGPRSPATLANPNSSDALATNVVDLAVWLYVRDSSGNLRRIFPSDNGDFSHTARDTGAAPDATRFPDVADVMVRILSEAGATLIAEMEKGGSRVLRPPIYGTDAEWWWAVVDANSRPCIRRIELKGKAR